jgi:hypothetical protein
MKPPNVEFHGRRSKKKNIVPKKIEIEIQDQRKLNHLLIMLFAYYNIGVIEDLFNTSFVSLGDARLLDTSVISHYNYLFDDNVDGVVYFIDIESLKPLIMGTIMLKFPGLPDFLLHNVLYLLELQRNLLSLVHIR